MVLKGMFLHVIRTCISTKVMTLRCKQFSDWLTCNVMRILFPNNISRSQIICSYVLLTTTFFLHIYPLTAYYVP